MTGQVYKHIGLILPDQNFLIIQLDPKILYEILLYVLFRIGSPVKVILVLDKVANNPRCSLKLTTFKDIRPTIVFSSYKINWFISLFPPIPHITIVTSLALDEHMTLGCFIKPYIGVSSHSKHTNFNFQLFVIE